MGNEIVDLLERCAAENDAAMGESTFGSGAAVFVGKREVAHQDGPATLDIRLTKSVIRDRREALRDDDRVELRRNQSDWLEFTVARSGDLTTAEDLIVTAIEANRSTASPGAPPTGSELERRRRFH